MASLLRHKLLKHLTWLTGDSAFAEMLNDGLVLLDSDGNYLMDETGHILYANNELFTVDGVYFSTADGSIFGVPAQ